MPDLTQETCEHEFFTVDRISTSTWRLHQQEGLLIFARIRDVALRLECDACHWITGVIVTQEELPRGKGN